MNKIDMSVIKTFIEDELYDLSRADKDTVFSAIDWLITDLEIDEVWINNTEKQDKSLERYIFDGVIEFMNSKDINADELYNYEDELEIFDCIHGF